MATNTFRLQYLAKAAAGVPQGPRQHVRQREAPSDPSNGAHLQLHLGLRCPLHDVQQLEMG